MAIFLPDAATHFQETVRIWNLETLAERFESCDRMTGAV